ncbi:MAG: hypothetical protein WDZ72_14560, partial [Cyclobacteriaceae bacterium]
MKKLLSLLLSIVVLITLSQTLYSQELLDPSEVVLHIGKEGQNPRNSEGSFIQLMGGRILFI